jgi:phosphonate transport system permease protein
MTVADLSRIDASYGHVIKASRRASLWPVLIVIGVLLYLAYAWFHFDMTKLVSQSRLDRGLILATDSFAYKIHVEHSFHDGANEFSIEGQRDTRFDEPPPWVDVLGDGLDIDLGEGYRLLVQGRHVTLTGPDWEPLVATSSAEGVTLEGELPEWAKLSETKFEARPTLFRRVIVLRSGVEVHRYFVGWEDFWFPFDSPLNGVGFFQVAGLAFSGDRIDPDTPNWLYIFDQFWTNPEWQHGDVFVALLQTVIMAFVGTALAAMIGMPLAFLAAANFNRVFLVRMALRRCFDFVRAIDHLIWSLVFIRAFGLGPLSGIMAIAITDIGTLGKLFSEAIENIDNKPVDGIASTGAGAVQRYRFGVVPQILPVFVSQSLYYLESNTRSATVIGALGAGGIGLKLVETLRTGVDWENTLYIITLTVAVVMLMDVLSTWLRRRLIAGGTGNR